MPASAISTSDLEDTKPLHGPGSGAADRVSSERIAPLRAGVRITPELQLVRRIGRGAMGSVWAARHTGMDALVALKFMAPEFAADEASCERFRREAQAAMRLQGPNVVRVFDYVATPGALPYIVMELLDGENLQLRLARRGPLTLEQTASVVAQVAEALAAAHEQGIVHRDIKPENLFLAADRADDALVVKVVDFGLALQTTDSAPRLTRTGISLGTPLYMSPEQLLQTGPVDFRCDLWSLAAVAYVCLTGRPLFEGDTFRAVCAAVTRGQFTPPGTLRVGLPKSVDEWFARALARRVDERFQSAREMAEALLVATRASAGEVEGEIPRARKSRPSSAAEALSSLTWSRASTAPETYAPIPPAEAKGDSARVRWMAPLFAVAVLIVVSGARPSERSFARAPAASSLAPVSAPPEPQRADAARSTVAYGADAGTDAPGVAPARATGFGANR